jgi:phosphotransferase system HPr-like phosphotransfer protein
MKLTTRTVTWMKDRPLQHVVELVQLAGRFHSTIILRCNGEIADLRRRSVVTIVALCVMATVIEVEVTGDDEQDAARSVQELFQG